MADETPIMDGPEILDRLRVLFRHFVPGTYADGEKVIVALRAEADRLEDSMSEHMRRDS